MRVKYLGGVEYQAKNPSMFVFTRLVQSRKSIIDDNRYQSIPIDINLSIDIDNRPIDGKDSCGYRLHGIGFQ